MTDPLPWPRNAERYRSDAIRYARTIKRLKENVTRLVQNNPTAVAVLNEIVWRNFSTDTWVNFKLFGTLALTLAFVIVQGFYLGRFLQEEG